MIVTIWPTWGRFLYYISMGSFKFLLIKVIRTVEHNPQHCVMQDGETGTHIVLQRPQRDTFNFSRRMTCAIQVST